MKEILKGGDLIAHQRRLLEQFLVDCRSGILPLRSYRQIRESGSLVFEEGQEESLKRQIIEKSEGKLKPESGKLCEIEDYGIPQFRHHGKTFDTGLEEGARVVRGFFFLIILDDSCPYPCECMVLDNGISREFYDKMTPIERKSFVKRVARRYRGFICLYPSDICGFTAFINDTPDGFTVDGLYPAYSLYDYKR